MQRLHDELQQVLAGYGTLSLEQKIAVLTELLQPNLGRVSERKRSRMNTHTASF